MGKLVLYMPDGSTREILLTRERIRIGRRPDNDVPLPFPAVSGEHAAIVTILSDSFLEDLGSTNGTFVNGKPVTKHFLRDRDRIDVGRENLLRRRLGKPRAASSRALEQSVCGWRVRLRSEPCWSKC